MALYLGGVNGLWGFGDNTTKHEFKEIAMFLESPRFSKMTRAVHSLGVQGCLGVGIGVDGEAGRKSKDWK